MIDDEPAREYSSRSSEKDWQSSEFDGSRGRPGDWLVHLEFGVLLLILLFGVYGLVRSLIF